MNFALSRRGAGRHPVGLSVVIALHVVLAVAIVAGGRVVPPKPPVIDPVLFKPEPPRPPVPQAANPLPQPHQPTLTMPRPEVPVIPDDTPRPTAQPRTDDATSVEGPVARADTGRPELPASLHVQPHAAAINAGAAQCRPDYPAAAVRAGATGTSRIRFNVDASGVVSGAQILASSGATREHRLLDKAAAEALARCPIVVGTDDLGRPVGTTVDVEYVWTLN